MRLAIHLIASGEVITRIVGFRSVHAGNLPGSPEEQILTYILTLKTAGTTSAEFFNIHADDACHIHAGGDWATGKAFPSSGSRGPVKRRCRTTSDHALISTNAKPIASTNVVRRCTMPTPR